MNQQNKLTDIEINNLENLAKELTKNGDFSRASSYLSQIKSAFIQDISYPKYQELLRNERFSKLSEIINNLESYKRVKNYYENALSREDHLEAVARIGGPYGAEGVAESMEVEHCLTRSELDSQMQRELSELETKILEYTIQKNGYNIYWTSK